MPATHYSANFPLAGKVETRTSTSARTYTHAWCVRISGRVADASEIEHAAKIAANTAGNGTYLNPARASADYLAHATAERFLTGFAGSAQLAQRAAEQAAKGWRGRSVLSVEIVPVATHATRAQAQKAKATA